MPAKTESNLTIIENNLKISSTDSVTELIPCASTSTVTCTNLQKTPVSDCPPLAPMTQPRKASKRKLLEDSEFEQQIIKRWDVFIDKTNKTSRNARFGEEVAIALDELNNKYKEELLKRKIRELIFDATFSEHQNQSAESQDNVTQSAFFDNSSSTSGYLQFLNM